MRILDRYTIRELIPPFVGGLAVIMFVLLLDYILKILNLIIAKGVPVGVVLQLFFNSLAALFALAVPMACLLAALMSFGRLSGDREVVALKALGLPFWRVMMPAALFMTLISVAMIEFGDVILPEANMNVKTLMVQIHRKKPMTALRPRVFIEEFPNVVLYMEQVDDKAGRIYGVTLYEKREHQQPRIIMAPEGEVRHDASADAITFTLHNGEVHDVDPEDPTRYTRVQFARQVITIGDLGTQMGDEAIRRRGDRELSIGMLRNEIRRFQGDLDSLRENMCSIVAAATDSIFKMRGYEREVHATPERRALLSQRKVLSQLQKYRAAAADAIRRRRKLEVEYQKKFSLPLACLVFLLLGAPVGAWVRKGGIGIAVGLSFGFFLIYWAFLIGGEELADRGIISPVVGMWTGNIVMTIIALVMLYRVTYEARFSGLGWFAAIFRKRKDR